MHLNHFGIMSSILLSLAGYSTGTVNIDEDVSLIRGSSATLTCNVNPVSSSVSWNTDRYQTAGSDNIQTLCLTSGTCLPPTSVDDPRYSFNSSIAVGALGQYSMFISAVDCLDSAEYTCVHGSEIDKANFPVKVIPDSVLISDDGTTVVAETSCLYAEGDIELKWYSVSVSTSENKTYTLPSNREQNSTATGCPTDCGSTKVIVTFEPDKPTERYTEVRFKVEVRHTANPAVFREATTANTYRLAGATPPRPPECCCICCFIALILNVVLNVVLVLVHVILTWQKHEFSVKKIYSGNNETNEAVCFKDYGIKAALPECCVCVVTIVIQIAVYFAALIQKDCGDSCDKCCEVVICLVVTIIVSIVEAAAGSGIIYIFVNVKGCNYVDQGGNVDSGDSACCGRNNSILPICAGDDQQRPDGNKQKLSQGPRHRDVGTHQPGEPNSKTTKTDESGSFVSGKDIKVDTGGSSSFRAQPPLPDIKSEKKNTRGLSANIDDSDINNPSYEKKRLTPIGQESHPGWEEKTDRSEDGKEKKKKRKNKDKDKERDSNVTESADL